MKEFSQGTKNQEIFETTAPYNNPHQGTNPRWLFVCSAGLLRSPTGATMAAQRGINARSCGSSGYALIPCTANLINWAEIIVVVNYENFGQLEHNFEGYPKILEQLDAKSVILDIPDRYNYMHPELQTAFQEQLFDLFD